MELRIGDEVILKSGLHKGKTGKIIEERHGIYTIELSDGGECFIADSEVQAYLTSKYSKLIY